MFQINGLHLDVSSINFKYLISRKELSFQLENIPVPWYVSRRDCCNEYKNQRRPFYSSQRSHWESDQNVVWRNGLAICGVSLLDDEHGLQGVGESRVNFPKWAPREWVCPESGEYTHSPEERVVCSIHGSEREPKYVNSLFEEGRLRKFYDSVGQFTISLEFTEHGIMTVLSLACFQHCSKFYWWIWLLHTFSFAC